MPPLAGVMAGVADEAGGPGAPTGAGFGLSEQGGIGGEF